LIRNWAVTGAAAYEGLMLRQGLLDKTNIPVRRCGPTPPTLAEERGVPKAANHSRQSMAWKYFTGDQQMASQKFIEGTIVIGLAVTGT
jgi:hypothetical protein